MSGRNEQLGKQLRRLRTSAAIEDEDACATALRRAIHLARDLADEHEGLEALVAAGTLDAPLAASIGKLIETEEVEEPLVAGAQLDRFLRSIEHGALMPHLPFDAYENVGGIADSATTKSAVMVSGRQVLLAERGHEGMVFVDDQPIGRPFPLMGAPRSKPEVHHEASGVTRIVWEAENLVVELAANFGSASIISPE